MLFQRRQEHLSYLLVFQRKHVCVENIPSFVGNAKMV